MTEKKKREPKPKGYCIFCHKGFDIDAGGGIGASWQREAARPCDRMVSHGLL